MKKLVPALAAAVLAGCNALTDANTFNFTYSVDALDAAPATPEATTVNTSGGTVRISGVLSTACGDQRIRMDGSRSRSEVHVTVDPQIPGSCTGGETWYSYNALITLPVKATYHLLMTNTTGGTPATVVDQQVTTTG